MFSFMIAYFLSAEKLIVTEIKFNAIAKLFQKLFISRQSYQYFWCSGLALFIRIISDTPVDNLVIRQRH